MKDVKPEETPKNAEVEKYTTEFDKSRSDKALEWLARQNWLLWGALTGIIWAIAQRL